jgi:hypothetical protein
VGGALGLAVISTAATSRVRDALAHGAAPPHALAAGYDRGLLIAAAITLANLALGLLRAPRITPDAAIIAEATAG